MSAKTRWDNLNIAFKNFLSYIDSKSDRFSLTFIDLLYVTNFKGGNSSIIISEHEAEKRLLKYSEVLMEINLAFGKTPLGQLNKNELDQFVVLAQKFIELPLSKPTEIKGLKSSVASALLCAHFPDLAPVIDRNVLAGLGIDHEKNSQGQVKNIENHYGRLIKAFHSELEQNRDKSLRELDRELFIQGSVKR